MLPIRDTIPGRNPPIATWVLILANAGPELMPEAGARDERTLEAVSSRPWFK
jgi:hypothetical protein